MWGYEEAVRILPREQLERWTEKGNVQSKKVLRRSHGRQGDAYCKGHELLTWTQWAELGRLGTCVALRPRDVHSEAVLHTGHQE